MIFDVLANADRYAAVHPLFAECFAYLKNTDLAALPVGRQPLGASGCTVIVAESAPKTKQNSLLEGHRVFIDIQVVLAVKNSLVLCRAAAAPRSPTTWPTISRNCRIRRVSDPASRLFRDLLSRGRPPAGHWHRRAQRAHPQDRDQSAHGALTEARYSTQSGKKRVARSGRFAPTQAATTLVATAHATAHGHTGRLALAGNFPTGLGQLR